MKKSGDLVDEDNMVISEKITDREMFKNSNLNKPTVEGQMEKINAASNRIKEIQKEQAAMYKPKVDTVEETVTYIKTLEPMTALKEANLVIGRKGKYKDLTPDQSKKILQDTEDHIFERDIPDEDFAKGGRAGFNTGGASNPNKRQGAVEEKTIDPRTSTQPDDNRPQSVNTTLPTGPAGIETIVTGEDDFDTKGFLSRVRKKNQERYLDLLNKYKVDEFDAYYDLKPSAITEEEGNFLNRYGVGQVYRDLSQQNFENFLKIRPKGVPPRIDPSRVEDSGNFKYNFAAEGGRIGYYTGGITDVEPSLDDIGHGSDSLMARTRLVSPGSQATTSTGLNYLLAEDNDNHKSSF
jgi:hypothetical protein